MSPNKNYIGAGMIAITVVLFWVLALPFYNRTPFDDFTIIQMICGGAAIIGHIWTAFAGFRGGKGIATGAGMLLGVTPVEFGISASVFFIVFMAYKYVSLGSISAAVAFPATLFIRFNIFGDEIHSYKTLIIFSLGVALLLIYSHRANIRRLIEGTENRVSQAAKQKPVETE